MGRPSGRASDRRRQEKRATAWWPWRSRRSDPETSVVVCGLAVGGDVEALALVFLADAQADRHVDQLVGDQRDDARPGDRHQDRLGLRPDLAGDRVVLGLDELAGEP